MLQKLKNGLQCHGHLWLLITAGVVIWMLHAYIHKDSLNLPDAAIYADTAKHIVQDNRVVTSVTWPQYLLYFGQNNDGLFDPQYAPLWPFALSLVYRIFGITDTSVRVAGLIMFLATVPVLYALFSRLFDKFQAKLAVFLYLINPQILIYSASGVTEPMFTFELAVLFYVLIVATPTAFFVSGVVVAAAVFTRYQGLLLILPVVGYIFFTQNKHRVSSLAWFGLGGSLSVFLIERKFPGALTHYLAASKYLAPASLGIHYLFGSEITRTLKQVDVTPFVLQPLLLLKRLVFNLYLGLKGGLTYTLPVILMFFYLSWFKKYTGKVRLLHRLVSLMWGIFFLSLLTMVFDYRYIFPLIPFMTIFAVDVMWQLFKKLQPERQTFWLTAFCFLFIVLPALTYNATGTALVHFFSGRGGKPTMHEVVARFVEKTVSPGALVVSDEAAHIAWYTGRRTIMLPANEQILANLDATMISADAVVLTNHPVTSSFGKAWDALVSSPSDFGKFKFVTQMDLPAEGNYYGVPLRIVLFTKKLF